MKKFSPFQSYFNANGQPTVEGQHLLLSLAALDSPIFTGAPVLPSYTVAMLPANKAGAVVFVSDESGGAVLAFSDGAVWRRVTDHAVVT